MIVQNTWGQCLCSQKIVPGDTVTALSSSCYQYKEYTFTYNSGSAEPSAGAWLIGATSGAQAICVSASLSTGTWGGGDAVGTIRVKSVSGTFSGTENINNGASGNVLTMTSTLRPVTADYMYKGKMACTAVLQVLNQTAMVTLNDGTPDQTAHIAIRLVANQDLTLQDINDIMKCRVVDYTSGSASTILAHFWFV